MRRASIERSRSDAAQLIWDAIIGHGYDGSHPCGCPKLWALMKRIKDRMDSEAAIELVIEGAAVHDDTPHDCRCRYWDQIREGVRRLKSGCIPVGPKEWMPGKGD